MRLFDSHLHIIDARYPLISNNGYIPDSFNCSDYLASMSGYTLHGGAVVSGSFQGFDQRYLIDALSVLGEGYVGVTQIPASTSSQEIERLNAAGIRALRFNLKRGGSEDVSQLANMAARVHEIAGWHIELYVDSADLAELTPRLLKLPAVSIDHLGLTAVDQKSLYTLVESGVKVKATGFGRVDFDVVDTLKAIHRINPAALMFGSDLPSTRAPRPYTDDDYALVTNHFNDDDCAKIMYKNAENFYLRGD